MEGGAEYSGKTLEDAIRQAESQLGVRRDQLDIEVITAGRGGVFGIGAEPARVQARVQTTPDTSVDLTSPVDSEPDRFEEEPLEAMPQAESEHLLDDEETAGPESSPAPLRTEGLAEEARGVLSELLHNMGFEVEVTVRSEEDPIILAVTGGNLGILIGRRGDNLASLQFMVNLILSKNRRQWPRIVIDVENYRARREESLRALADRIAYRVRRNGRPFTLEAMPASDRRVIHLTLRDRSEVETYSIGEGVARRVVIAPKHENAASRDHDLQWDEEPSSYR